MPGGSADGAAAGLYPAFPGSLYAPAKAFGRIYNKKATFKLRFHAETCRKRRIAYLPPIEPRQAALGETWR